MSLYDKCFEFKKRIDYLKSQNYFFYFREFNPAADPVVTRKGKKMIMLGSNNYLNLTSHPKVVDATIKAIEEYGTGACSSRILTGTTSLHNKLEKRLAEFKETEDCVVYSTGFTAMMGTVAAMTEAGDIIISDELNHASIVDGCRISKAQVKIYKHNDMISLEDQLANCSPDVNKLIVTDGVFSMKGSVANLPGIKKLANKYNAQIMVDDAHGTGVLGKKGHGTLEHFDLEGKIAFVCGTFSKALGTIGGFTGATHEVVEYLKLNSRSFIFTASPPPSIAATVLASLDVIEKEPELLQRLHKNSNLLKQGLKEIGFVVEDTITPIIPVLINDDEKTFKMAGQLEDEGVIVNPIVPPAVPKDNSIIRVSVTAGHTDDDIGIALEKFKKVGKKLEII